MNILYEINSNFIRVDIVIREIISYLNEECNVNDTWTVFIIKFTLRELLNNAVEHGNKMDFDKKVICNFFYEKNKITIEVMDQGDGFEYLNKIKAKNEEIQMRSRGIETIEKLGFVVDINKNNIKAVLKI